MLAVDTNVIVRLLTGDDPVQSPQARSVFAEGEILIVTSVLLETEPVLRRVYRYDRRVVGRMSVRLSACRTSSSRLRIA